MRKIVWIILGVIVLLLVVLISGATFFTDWLWFKSMGITSVFWTAFTTGLLVRVLAFTTLFAFIFLNLRLALRAFRHLPAAQENNLLTQFQIGEKALPWLCVAASLLLALFLSAALPGWTAIQQFLHSVSTNTKDPVLHKDIGYYLFRYPVWRSLYGLTQGVLWLTLIGTGAVYWLARAFWRQGKSFSLWAPAKWHLTILAALLFLAKIWGYQLAKVGLLLSNTGLLTGVDYTAAHARLPVFGILSWIAGLCVVILVLGLFRRSVKLLIGGIGLLLAASIVLGTIYPGLLKSIVVAPNIYAKEKPYLQNNIEATRKAFGLDKFEVKSYFTGQVDEAMTMEGSPTIANLRLWDFRALQQSYEQLQTLRPYYTFSDIDIDRYTINGKQRGVMLSARELDMTQLPANAQNWPNLHLNYTHGYGLALNSVSDITGEGQPEFLIGDIPPVVANSTDLPAIKQPRLYFGETQNDYVVAPNGNREFDHPTKGDENVSVDYQGRDGVKLSSFWTRLLFAFRFGEPNFILSNYITPESKALYYRRIMDRVRKLAPFLDYDQDPYLVVSEGRLFWIMDAYTYSGNYPYATHHENGVNYIRNSVKVIIDAYHGTVDFYIMDQADPIIRVWRNVFPSLFKPLAAMPASLREHLRYPEQLFIIQRDLLLMYHMTDSGTFFSKEDAWAVPTETYTGTEEILAPYYLTLKLPGEQKGEFVLMEPLKPNSDKRKNMIAWMAARCDGDQYGQVLLYLLAKDKIYYGPIQVEGRIAQNPEISKLISLWDQAQSRVLRGNLLVLPFAGDFLYVEPMYIVSEQGQQPELKLIVLVYRDRVEYGSTLAEVLDKLKGAAVTPTTAPTAPGTAKPSVGLTPAQLDKLLGQLEQSIKSQQDAIARQQQILSQLRNQVVR